MNRNIAYLGPVLMVLGAGLAQPRPHPLFDEALAMGVLAVALLIAFVGIRLGSAKTVLASLLVAIVPTFPTVVPISWLGIPLLVIGAALTFEGASAHETDLPLSPLRAWALPLGLCLIALAVPLIALTSTIGRESLDIAQGLGVAASAPLLLAGAWGILAALDRRRETKGTLAVTLLAVTLLGGLLLVAPAPPASAQTSACEDPRSASAFEDCPMVKHILAEPHDSSNVTENAWTLNASRVLLIEPGFEPDAFTNMTIHDAQLGIELDMHLATDACSTTELTVQTATGPWSEATNATQAPPGEHPVTVSPTQQECDLGQTLNVDVTPHLQAWADGAPMHGWRITLTQGDELHGTSGPYTMDAAYDVNEPRIHATSTTPTPHDGFTPAPVGEPLTVNTTLQSPSESLKEATLTVDDDNAHHAPLGQSGTHHLTFTVTETIANGTLTLTVVDWDGNENATTVTELRPDREPPTLEPPTTVQSDPDTITIPDPLPEDEPATLPLNLTDDLCWLVDPCVFLDILDADGDTLASLTANATHPTTKVPLPTDTPGQHSLLAVATDTADRVNTTLIHYTVSELRPPTLTNLTITDHQHRENQQEAGLPLHVTLTVEDESPPVHVNITDQDTLVASKTVHEEDATITLSPVLNTPGTRALTITAEDRWGNQARTTETVHIHPERAPTITLPQTAYIPSQATLTAHVNDASVTPENVTVQILQGGNTLETATITKTLNQTGIDVTVNLPELLHGERIRLILTATDQHGHFATAATDPTVDAEPPTLTLTPEPGARLGPTLWATPQSTLIVAANDTDSGTAHLALTQPHHQPLDPQGDALPIQDLLEEPLRIETEDHVGNHANWTGTLRIDDEPPQASLDINGHDILATVHEDQSGLDTVRLTANGETLPIPNTPGEHRVTVPGVTRGDTVHATLTATDRVGHTTTQQANLTVEKAPPDVRISNVQDRNVTLFITDPDGDPVTTHATLTHLVNGTQTQWTLDPGQDTLHLPPWRGDVQLATQSTAYNVTTHENRTFTLGEAPYLSASAPTTLEPDEPGTVNVAWERAYEHVTVVVHTEEGRQHDVLNVTETQPGQGTAQLALPEGSYTLDVRGQHPDGTVTTNQVGTVDVTAGPSTAFIAIGALLLIALVGLLVLSRLNEDEDHAPPT